MVECACGERWRIEACDMRTGLVIDILHPTAFDFETYLNQSTTGSMTLVTQETHPRQVWPHLVSVYITRVAGGDASFTNPVVEFAGFVEEFEAEGNSTRVGLRSIDYYLWHRVLADGMAFVDTSQNEIAKQLVEAAQPNGIPLFAQAAPSAWFRQRTYEPWDKKNIGEAIQQLTEVIGGPDWEITHEKVDGRWSSTMQFHDEIGINRNVVLQSDVELSDYGMVVDAQDHATRVIATGEGEEEDMITTSTEDESGTYPQFDTVISHPDVSVFATLVSHAEGWLEDHQEPFAAPELTIAGLDPDPSLIQLGDTIEVRVNFGLATYNGDARVLGSSWAVDPDNPDRRTLQVLPTTRASQSVLSQEPTDNCEDC